MSSPSQTDAAFLASYDPTAFERPSVAVDVALLTAFDGALHALLIRRPAPPEHDKHALPGGFVGIEEALDAAARRALRDKAGLDRVFIEQLYTFGAPRRDPRTRVITVAYVGLINAARFTAALDAKPGGEVARLDVPWEGETGGAVRAKSAVGKRLRLAFDHADILGMAVKRLRGKLNYTAVGFQLLPPAFTLRALQEVHETILGHDLNKDSFRRRMLASGALEATGEREEDVGHRPAELYRFVRQSAV